MATPALEPQITDGNTRLGRWMTVIYNNDHNTVDEVVEILMRATRCDAEEASIETWEAHTFGHAPVHFSSREDCERAASVISTIGVRTEVKPEWED